MPSSRSPPPWINLVQRWPLALFCLLCLLYTSASATPAVLISSPFDNFRIECPRYSGAQRLAIRMIESRGMKRQDAVFTISCNHIAELYPWVQPPEVAEMEREDCRYSIQFDPVMDKELNYTCGEREYIAGLARLSDTNIQVQCCRMRTRDQSICVKRAFPKPLGRDRKTEIEYAAKLINSLAIEDNVLLARFCDLVPRNRTAIREDVKKAPPSRPGTSNTLRAPQPSFPHSPPPVSFSLAHVAPPAVPAQRLPPSRPFPVKTTPSNPEEDATQEPEQNNEQKPKKVIRVQHQFALSKNAQWESRSTTQASSTARSLTTPNDKDTLAPSDRKSPPVAGKKPIPSGHAASQPSGGSESTLDNFQKDSRLAEDNAADGPMKTLLRGAADRGEQPSHAVFTRAKASGLPVRAGEQEQQSAGGGDTVAKDKEFAERMLKQIDDGLRHSSPASGAKDRTGPSGTVSGVPASTTGQQPPAKAKSIPGSTTSSPIKKEEDKEDILSTVGAQPNSASVASGKGRVLLSAMVSTPVPIQSRHRFEDTDVDAFLQSQTTQTTDRASTSMTLPPFDAFPSPPPPGGGAGQMGVKKLPQLPPTTRRPSPASKTRTTNGHGMKGDEYDDEIAQSSSASNGRTHQPTAATVPDHSGGVTSAPKRGRRPPQRRPSSSSVKLPLNVDEETIDSPFDARKQSQRLSELTDEEKMADLDLFGTPPATASISHLRAHSSPTVQHQQSQPDGSRAGPFDPDDTNLNPNEREIRRAPRPHFADSMINHEKSLPSVRHIGEVRKNHVELFFPAPAVNRDVSDESNEANVDVPSVNGNGRSPSSIGMAAIPIPVPTMMKDGVKSYEPLDGKAVKMPELLVYDRLDAKNLPPLAQFWMNSTAATAPAPAATILNNLVPMAEERKGPNPSTQQQTTVTPAAATDHQQQQVFFPLPSDMAVPVVRSQYTVPSSSQQPLTSSANSRQPQQDSATTTPEDDEIVVEGYFWTRRTTTPRPETTKTYDVSQFYQLPKRQPPPTHKEKVLTFCSKENALRDTRGMVIACGGVDETWTPERCPPRSECFTAADSTYRICCPIGV